MMLRQVEGRQMVHSCCSPGEPHHFSCAITEASFQFKRQLLIICDNNIYFHKEKMSNLFYFNNMYYTPIPLAPTVFYTTNLDHNLLFLPLQHSQHQLQRIQKTLQDVDALEATSSQPAKDLEYRGARHCKNVVVAKALAHRKQKEEEEKEQQEFKIKQAKTGVKVTYKKKNTESNIVNQTFSFLYSQRSKNLVQAFFRQDQQKVREFYFLMAKVKKMNRKYISRKYLKKLIDFADEGQFQRLFSKCKLGNLTLIETRKLLRCLTFQFLRENVNMTLLTSSKIYKETLPEHFWRKREIMGFLFSQDELME